MKLKGKKIIIAVTGSIAAYKTANLTRLLVKDGAEVQVIMSQSASKFITPLTLSTLSKRPVLIDFEKDKTGQWNNHVDCGLWADLILVAPASANTIGKMANGLCDNFLLATYLSSRCPVWLAPAMDLDMYQHPAVKENLKKLAKFKHKIIDAEHGELASGLVGKGRMAEPEHILALVQTHFNQKEQLFTGKKVLITGGPTREALDPVRYITNHSSGKMAYAIANLFSEMGAEVTLVSGVVSQKALPAVKVVPVVSAKEMYQASKKYFKKTDISVLAAAVADYRPAIQAKNKIKKKGSTMSIDLVKTDDIALELGKIKRKNQITVGFALETNNEAANAQSKLERKNFDMIVLNSLQDKGAGFGHDTNKITIIDKEESVSFGLKSKQEVAQDILYTIKKRFF
jgi:phosphopantothenoylcysteine decarboxylase/phosphopantothenate--cysteine ligase